MTQPICPLSTPKDAFLFLLPLRELVRQLIQVPGQGGLELGQDAGSVLLKLLPTHAEVGLLQLDPCLLDVVHNSTRLKVINPILH